MVSSASGRKDAWTEEQTRLAFYLYCQMPFGKMHSRNPEIIELANKIGRSPSAVAMKLVNFASLDPDITTTGRVGLRNASATDKKVWEEFHDDWEALAEHCEGLLVSKNPERNIVNQAMSFAEPDPATFVGADRQAMVNVRIKQSFFRRSVLANYGSKCCMSGMSAPQLIVASHIVPWAKDARNRLNPRNGLCLSSIHDRAFDSGLITVTPEMRIEVSGELRRRASEGQISAALAALQGEKIKLPARFCPDRDFLYWHNRNVFVGT